MISDVLFETIQQIHGWREGAPQYYVEVDREMTAFVAICDHMRHWLDTPEPAGKILDGDYLRHVADWLDNPDLPLPKQ